MQKMTPHATRIGVEYRLIGMEKVLKHKWSLNC